MRETSDPAVWRTLVSRLDAANAEKRDDGWSSFEVEAVRNEKVMLLRSIRLPTVDDIDRIAVRGRLLLDALIGDPTLFIRSDQVAQCWRIIDPIIDYWTDDPSPIPIYEAASWGPTEADSRSNAMVGPGETLDAAPWQSG